MSKRSARLLFSFLVESMNASQPNPARAEGPHYSHYQQSDSLVKTLTNGHPLYIYNGAVGADTL